jgi:hypothetical protein
VNAVEMSDPVRVQTRWPKAGSWGSARTAIAASCQRSERIAIDPSDQIEFA